MKKMIAMMMAALAITTAAQAEKLVFKGSDTLGAKLVPQLLEAFKAEKKGFTYELAAEGSTTGITALIDGTADVCMSSRRVKPTELSDASSKGVNFSPTIAAFDGIGVVVNNANGIKSLTKKQVADIFTGAVTDWSELGGKAGKIAVYTRNTASGTYQDFKELAMHKAEYAPGSQKMAGNEQIAEEVGKNPNGVGYVGIAYINAKGLKCLPIDGVTLSNETVKNQSYPYQRPTFFYTNGTPSGLAKEFIEFAHSSKGAAIVARVGFVPAK